MARRLSCYICKEKWFLHRHHIIPRANGGSNDPSNIITLCPTCHAAAHRGLYSEAELFRLKEFVESAKTPKASDVIPKLPFEVTCPDLSPRAIHALEQLREIAPVERLLK